MVIDYIIIRKSLCIDNLQSLVNGKIPICTVSLPKIDYQKLLFLA